MIELMILRHAPTAWNAEKRIQGRTDVPLSPAGRAMAATWRLPEQTAGWQCVTSPLVRAVETARLMRLAPAPLDALIEMDWGALEGRTLPEIRAEGGETFAAEEARGLDFCPPGGESPREVGARALAGLQTIETDAVIVTHKGVLRALYALATGWDMRAKAPARFNDHSCHHFVLYPDGRLVLVTAGIPLVPARPPPYAERPN